MARSLFLQDGGQHILDHAPEARGSHIRRTRPIGHRERRSLRYRRDAGAQSHDDANRFPEQVVWRHAGRLQARQPRDQDRHDVFGLCPASPGRRKAAGGLVSVGTDLHPRQRDRERRIPQRLRRTRIDLRRARHQPARRRTCPAIPRTPTISGLAPASMSMRRRSRLRAITACGAMSRKNCRSWSPNIFPSIPARQSILGHSMGGHGALTVALRHPDRYRAASAFSPIVAPSHVPWGIKALGGYLGDNKQAWRKHDAVALIEDGARFPELLVDYGDADPVPGRTASPGTAARRLREGEHSPHLAPPARLRPQLLLHLDLHGRSSALARRASEG